MSTTPSDRPAALRSDPFSQLPPHIAAQYAYLRRSADLAETIADLILLARDFVRAMTRALIGGYTLAAPRPANTDIKSAPLVPSMERPAKAANSDATPRIA
jgi:hypothetical protein